MLPGGLRLSDEASERIFGTSPPAAGLTLVSGAGSGKYDGPLDVREAVETSVNTASSAATHVASPRRRIRSP